MKVKIILGLVTLAAFVACKTPYKATDRPTPTIDNAATATTDSTRMRAATDTSSIIQPVDTAKMPVMPVVQDSTKVPSAVDTAMTRSTDSLKTPLKVDSSKIQSSTDTALKQSATDIAGISTKADSAKESSVTKAPSSVNVPAGIQTTFTTQYPKATNAEWTNYDSLAVVPIDLRMAGWKKMNAEDYLVKFDMDDENYYAWYDSDGKWVGSAYNLKDPSKLPAPVNTAIKNAIKTRYAGYTVSNVNREFQKDKKAYEVELKKDESKVKMLVNADGKITQVFKYVKDKK